jgi:hypothetical protein
MESCFRHSQHWRRNWVPERSRTWRRESSISSQQQQRILKYAFPGRWRAARRRVCSSPPLTKGSSPTASCPFPPLASPPPTPKFSNDKLTYRVQLSMSPNLSFSLKSRQTFSFLLMYLYNFFAMYSTRISVKIEKGKQKNKKTKTLLNAMFSVILNYFYVIHTINWSTFNFSFCNGPLCFTHHPKIL